MKFQIGDKVKFRSTISPMNGMIATVVKVPDEGYEFLSPYYGLDFSIETGRTHNIQGLLPRPTGWIVNEEHASVLMELVEGGQEMEFRVGDLVEVFYGDENYNLDREPEEGSVGTIIKNDSDGTVLVSFEGFDGHTTPESDAWWVWKRHLKPASTVSKEFTDTTKEMTEIEKLSREALDEIYEKIYGFSDDDYIDDIKTIEKIIEDYNQKVEELQRPFKVGNIITGNPDSKKRYSATTADAVMRVGEVIHDGMIKVVILEHKDPKQETMIGKTFIVNEDWFRRVI